MADNEYNDEYQFDELDTMDSDPLSEKEESPKYSDVPPGKHPGEVKSNVRRKALIVVVLVALSMLSYKFFGSFFSSKGQPVGEIPSIPTTPETSSPSSQTSSMQSLEQQQPTQPTVAPVQAQAPVIVQSSVDNTQVNQKLSSLEASQQNLNSEMSAVNSKLSGIDANINQLNEKIADLNQMLTTLTSRLEQQSSELAILTERCKPKPVRHVAVRRSSGGSMYYIQAIIPGRAWLIASNGSTITVREGTAIPGYGIVKLIDPNQGRVLTGSGRIIRFSQQDS